MCFEIFLVLFVSLGCCLIEQWYHTFFHISIRFFLTFIVKFLSKLQIWRVFFTCTHVLSYPGEMLTCGLMLTPNLYTAYIIVNLKMHDSAFETWELCQWVSRLSLIFYCLNSEFVIKNSKNLQKNNRMFIIKRCSNSIIDNMTTSY